MTVERVDPVVDLLGQVAAKLEDPLLPPRVRISQSRRMLDGTLTAAVQVQTSKGVPNTVTAAAHVMQGPGAVVAPGANRAARRRSKQDNSGWQTEAWALLDEIGELWYAGQWMSAALSRVRLVAARMADNGEEPRILTGDAPAGIDPPDPSPESAQDKRVAELVARWAGGPAGQEQVQARAGWHLAITGDTYLVGRDDPQGGEHWMAYSNQEMQPADRGWMVDEGGGSEPLPSSALVIRCWRPHPRRFRESATAVRPAMPILRELRGLTMHVGAQIDSRLAGAGLLILPQSMTFPSTTQAGDFADGEDPFVQALMDAMIEPIKDRDAASAVVPLVIKVPDESVGKAQYLRFGDTALDRAARDLREEALERLSLSLDLPKEVMSGLGQTNHWGAWQIEESAIKMHVAPNMATLCHALTVGWLWPLLEAEGVEDARDYLVWFDTAGLTLRPDRSADAKELYDRAAIGAEALRRETGFLETDAPGEQERREQLLIRIVERAPTLAPIVLPLLGIDVPKQVAEQGRETVLSLGGIDPDDPAAATGPREDPIRDARKITQTERQEIANKAKPANGGTPNTRTASVGCVPDPIIVEGCHFAVLRALEYAGKRMVFGARKQQAELREVQQQHPYRMHMLVNVGERDVDHLLDGAWTCLLAGAENPAPLLPVLDNYVRLLLEHQVEHSREYLRAALQQAGMCGDA